MKTGEEKFDEEIRQKLGQSEVPPPPGFFDQIIPPSDKRKGFFWRWFSGIVLLGLTAGMMKYMESNDIERNYSEIKKKSWLSKSIQGESISNPSQTVPVNNKVNIINQPSDNSETNDAPLKHNLQKNETNNQKNISGGKKVSKTSGKLVSRETASRKVLKNDNSVFINGSRSRKTRDQITSYNYDLLNVPAPSLPYAEKTILQQQVRIMKPDKSAFISHKPTPYSIELAASKVFYSAKKNIETTDTIAIKLLAKSENADEKISAYVISAKLLYAFNHRFTIQAGINYLKIDEKLKFNHTEFYKQLNIDTSTYYILFPFSPPLLITEIDSTIESLSKNHDIRHHVKTEIVTILAGVRFNFPTGRFLIEPTITVNADLLTLGKGASNFNPELIDRNGARHYKKDIRFSISAGIQVGYSINEKLNVFIASGYQYAFAPITTTMDFYGQKLNLLSTGAGIRYTIFSKQATKTNLHGSDIVNN